MDKNLITFNITNAITIALMGAIGFAALNAATAFIGQRTQRKVAVAS